MVRVLLVAALPALLASACGGGPRQDATEKSGTFRVEVVGASFPARQHISAPVQLRVSVRNADRRTLRNVAVTVQTTPRGHDSALAFGQRVRGAELSDSARPV